MPWDPKQYLRFAEERRQPFDDLVQLVRPTPGRVIDLGCGTGSLTRELADRLGASEVVGLDSSPEMLAQAAAVARPGLRFQCQRIEELTGSWDVIFSNAALQWVEDHQTLIPKLMGQLRPGGQLAVQVPSNHTHPSHTLLVEISNEPPFVTALHGWHRRVPVLSVSDYAELLYASGGVAITAIEKVYPHVLPNGAALVEWMRGTALVPYLERLGPLGELFVNRYRERIRARYPEKLFWGFRRILFCASRPDIL